MTRVRDRRARRSEGLLLAAALLGSLGPSAAAAPPEVVRLHVPASRTATWFPAGTELTVLSPASLDALVEAARTGAARAAVGAPGPRLLRARHSARWDDGLLTGRSELVVSRAANGPALLPLDPWTPAVVAGADAAATAPVVSRDDGRLALRLDPGATQGPPTPATLVIDWQLRARPGSRGRRFQLGLPTAEVSEVGIDLPRGWEPEGPSGLRAGPVPGSAKGRSSWSFRGQGGMQELRLVQPEGRGDEPDGSSLWCGGPTRIELGDPTASWTTDWTVSGGPWAPRTLQIELDPGLELVEVAGPTIEEYRAEPPGETGAGSASGAGSGSGSVQDRPTRVSVRFRGRGGPAGSGTSETTAITIKALTLVPRQGSWTVPAARPLNAVWTGGTTTVRVSSSRVVRGVRERAGRRAVPGRAVGAGERVLSFDAERPAAVADLELERPHADASVDVRGLLDVGPGSPRLVCRAVWRVHQGPLHDLDLDLPPAWIPERVELEGVDGPVPWHPDLQPGGAVRVRVPFPTGDWGARPVALRVTATAEIAGGRGPLALPRVRPVVGRVADEVWVARAEPGYSLQPRSVTGLAWIDPALIADLPAESAEPRPGANGPAPRPTEGEPSRPALAWRWLTDTATALVDRERSESGTVALVESKAVVTLDRIRLQARIEVDSSDQPIRSLVVGLNGPKPGTGAWRFHEQSGGPELAATPLDPARRAAEGLTEAGAAWRLELSGPQRGKVVVLARFEGPWAGQDELPLVVLPRTARWTGRALVSTGWSLLTSVTPRGARVLDPDVTAASLTPEATATATTPADPSRGASAADLRRAHAFGYDSPDARVGLAIVTLTPAATEGLIRDAVLNTVVTPGLPTRNRLSLRVLLDRASSLGIALPSGTSLERVLRDGVAVSPTRSGASIVVPLGPGNGVQSRGQVTVDLEYRGDTIDRGGAVRLDPRRPEFSLPCLGLEWTVDAPAAWRVARHGPQLTGADPVSTGPVVVPAGWSELWLRLRRALGSPSSTVPPAASPRQIDSRAASVPPGSLTLGEWFLMWDAGPWPVVVDRAALALDGWGPRSRVALPHGPAEKSGSMFADLGSLGLAALPVGPLMLVTTSRESRRVAAETSAGGSGASSWLEALRQAAALGGDRSDRFQSAARWRSEPTPRVMAMPGAFEAAEGRRLHRFVARGWPESGADLELIDGRSVAAWGWLAGLAIVWGGLLMARRPRTERVALVVAPLGLGLVASVVGPPRLAGPAAGVVAGSLALACLSLGWSLPAFRRRRRVGGRGSTFHRVPVPTAAGPTGAVLLAFVGLGSTFALGQADGDRPILALVPYEGTPGPGWTGDRVVLRLADFQALRALADRPDEPPPPGPVATSALHRVSWRDRLTLVVESEFTLEGAAAADGTEEVAWSFPVTGTREIQAVLDGAALPVRIEEGGARASVRATAAREAPRPNRGRPRRLVVSRVVSAEAGGGSASASLEVNPVATARVEVAAPPSGLAAELPGARGRIVSNGQPGSVRGTLGPADRLELRWRDPTLEAAPRPAGAVEVLSLWDALPAGDRLRSRFTFRSEGGTSTVRIGLEPGVLVREVSVPSTTEVTWEGTPERPEWVATVSPRLPDGASVGLDLWRPRVAGAPPGGSATRTAPRAEPLGVEKFTATLALRRPPDWTGRMVAAGAWEVVTEEAFVRAWKSLPDEPLTLSGALRYTTTPGRGALPGVTTGPPAPLLQVRGETRLEVSAGRIDLATDATLAEADGPVFEAVVEGPEGFVPVSVTGEGLTDWSPLSDRSLRLRFDGPAARSRKIAVRGWVPAPPASGNTPAGERELDAPALRWPGQVELPGTLVATGPAGMTLAGGAPVETATIGPVGASPARTRLTCPVTRPGTAGRLRWKDEPLRVAVLVESQLTLDPETCEWTAVLRYDVWGGPLDVIHLKVPESWSRDLTVRIPGTGHRQAAESDAGSTRLALWPERPVWGSRRIVLRSSRGLGPGETLAFPEVTPLGAGGMAEAYLRIVNATGRAPSVEGSPGLQAVAADAIPTDLEFARTTLGATSSSCYRVLRPGWTLRLTRPGGRLGEAPPAGAGRSNVASARVECVVAPDGRVLGLARYRVAADSGPFLELDLAPSSKPIWASVNGAPALLLRAGGNRWEVSLVDRGPSWVDLIWQSGPVDGARPRRFDLPCAGGEPVPAIVTVYAPDGVNVVGVPSRLRPVPADQAALEQARWEKDQAVASLLDFDRAARGGTENLVAALVSFGLRLRQAERAATFDPESSSMERAVRRASVASVAATLRAQLDDALRNAALDAASASADRWLGLKVEGSEPAVAPTPEPAAAPRLRAIGRPRVLAGTLSGGSSALPALSISPPPSEPSPFGRAVTLVMAAALATSAAVVASRRVGGSARLGRLALAAALGLSALLGGPAGLGGAVGLALVGHRTGPRDRPTRLAE